MAKTRPKQPLKHTSYELFIGGLSILSIVNLALVYFVEDQALRYVLWTMNGLLTVAFAGDFVYRISTAPSKSRYFFREFGWADLAACLPLPQFKILRVFRLVKVGRLLRAFGWRGVVRLLIRDRANSALAVLLFLAILVMEFGSLGMLRIEQYADGSNIHTASDAMWYCIVTMSTVGYGDQYPVTNRGRLLGAFIILIGVGIFGTLTGYLANAFVGAPKEEEQKKAESENAVRRNVANLRTALAEQTRLLEQLEDALPDEGRPADS